MEFGVCRVWGEEAGGVYGMQAPDCRFSSGDLVLLGFRG